MNSNFSQASETMKSFRNTVFKRSKKKKKAGKEIGKKTALVSFSSIPFCVNIRMVFNISVRGQLDSLDDCLMDYCTVVKRSPLKSF